jgi:sugar/nucleoside kinase (ribokinase family)
VLVLGSDTLNGESERAVTMSVRALALERGWLVLYDPNLRPARWPDAKALTEAARAVLPGAALVKLSGDEAMALTRASMPSEAARALVRADAGATVVTLGAEGMLVATTGSPEPVLVRSRPAAAAAAVAVDATGAGDSVAAVMAAALARTLDPEVAPAVAELAAGTARSVVAERGALAGLPSAREARRELADVLRERYRPTPA